MQKWHKAGKFITIIYSLKEGKKEECSSVENPGTNWFCILWVHCVQSHLYGNQYFTF